MKKLKQNEFDVIIIGGGVAGISCSYWLSKTDDMSIGLIDSKESVDWDISNEVSNLQVGSLKYLFDIYKRDGIQEALKSYLFMKDNLELVSNELKIFQFGSYVNLNTSGTFNKFPNLCEINQFIAELDRYLDESESIEVLESKDSLKFVHEGTYSLRKYFKEIGFKVKERVEALCGHTCIGLKKHDEGIIVVTNKGEFYAKKVIFSNGQSLPTLLPELIGKIQSKKTFLFEIDTSDTETDRSNFIDFSKKESFYREKNKIFYSLENDEISLNDAKGLANNFCEKNFPQSTINKSVETEVAFTKDFKPLIGQSRINSNLFYLGGFSGQSKHYAFKMAHELVEKIKA